MDILKKVFEIDDCRGFSPSRYEKIKKKEVLTKSGDTVDITSSRKYYGFHKLETPAYNAHDFTLEELLPRDYRFFLKSDDKEKLVEKVKAVVMVWRWWDEVKLPHFFLHLKKDFQIADEDVKNGNYNVFMRISQSGENSYNRNYFTTPQAQAMVRRFKECGIFETAEGVYWNSYCCDLRHKDMCFAKGYKVNIPLLLRWMGAVNALIIKPFLERFGVDLRSVLKGDQDISAIPLPKMMENVEICEKHTKFGARRARWSDLRKKYGITAAHYNAICTYLNVQYSRQAKQYISDNNKEDCYGWRFKDSLNSSFNNVEREKMFGISLPPYRMGGGFRDGTPMFRGYSDLCSLPKKNGYYMGYHYKDRIEIFSSVFGFVKPREYDCPNSVHADNRYLMKGEWMEGDLYTEIIVPALKKRLMNDKEWFAPYENDLEGFEEFFALITDRAAMKRLCNVVFSRGTAGGLWNFLFVRMRDPSDELHKARLKRYAHLFAETYFSICGDSLKSYIYNVETYKMLHMAEKIHNEGYKVALIYDCLITEKVIDKKTLQYLYRSAMEEYAELNKGAIKELKMMIKRGTY